MSIFYEFIAVDLQNDFVHPNGVWFNKGSSVGFIKHTLLPYIKLQHRRIHEIVSDYGPPRPCHSENGCIQGTFGYQSILPNDLRHSDPWIKSMHNPTWSRHQSESSKAGLPTSTPHLFEEWLFRHLGMPRDSLTVVVFGLTMEICVLNLCQELYFRGYHVVVIYEATDPMNERLPYKNEIAYHSSIQFYAKVWSFDRLQDELEKRSD